MKRSFTTNFTRGRADQMISAFESKIAQLEGNLASSTDVTAAGGWDAPYGLADVKKYLNGKLEFYGWEIEMDFGDGAKLAKYLEKQGKDIQFDKDLEEWRIPGRCHWGDYYFYPYPSSFESSTSIKASVIKKKNNYVELESNSEAIDEYVHSLVESLNDELEDLDIFDSWTWEETEGVLVLTVIKDSDVQEYSIPYEDLHVGAYDMSEDIEYIMNAVTGHES